MCIYFDSEDCSIFQLVKMMGGMALSIEGQLLPLHLCWC